MLVVLRTARPLVVPRGTQRRLLSVSVGAVAGGCVMTRASHARMLEAAPPPPPATAILAQRRRAGADLDDDANVLQHLARACFRLARIVETSIRLGAPRRRSCSRFAGLCGNQASRCCLRSCVCSMAWSFYAIAATLFS